MKLAFHLAGGDGDFRMRSHVSKSSHVVLLPWFFKPRDLAILNCAAEQLGFHRIK
jgi:hypothetical protein